MEEQKQNNNKNTGTTIGCYHNKHTGSWFIFADKQITEGHRIFPGNHTKLYDVGDYSLLAGTGSVSDIQNLSKRVHKNIQMERLIADAETLDVDFETFVNQLSEYLFSIRLDRYMVEICSNFIIIGFNEKTESLESYSIGSDGSSIKIEGYYSDGSGSSYCIPQLKNLWDSNLKYSDLKIAGEIKSIIIQTSTIDLFTNDEVDIISLDKNGKKTIYTFKPILETKNETKTI